MFWIRSLQGAAADSRITSKHNINMREITDKQSNDDTFYILENKNQLSEKYRTAKIHPWTLVVYQGLIYLLKEVKLAASQ